MSDTIEAGTAVRHRDPRNLLLGRVRRVIGARAVVTWVRRRNVSVVYLANLERITDAELVDFFEQQEAMYDRIREQQERDGSDLAPPERATEENRQFLLGAAAGAPSGA